MIPSIADRFPSGFNAYEGEPMMNWQKKSSLGKTQKKSLLKMMMTFHFNQGIRRGEFFPPEFFPPEFFPPEFFPPKIFPHQLFPLSFSALVF